LPRKVRNQGSHTLNLRKKVAVKHIARRRSKYRFLVFSWAENDVFYAGKHYFLTQKTEYPQKAIVEKVDDGEEREVSEK
jgi:hypothetical protein